MSKRQLFRRLGADEGGATLVEFALLMLPLSLILFGSMDMGFLLYYRSQLQGALNDVARAASVESPQLAVEGSTLDERVDKALKKRVGQLVGHPTYKITKSNYFKYGSAGKPEKLTTDVDKDGQYDKGVDCWSDEYPDGKFTTSIIARDGRGSADDVAVYEVELTAPRLLPTAGLFGVSPNYKIIARTAVRNQPFAAQALPPVVC